MTNKLSLIILSFLCILPLAEAWNWETHQNIIDKIYGSFPTELKTKLDLDLMKQGSIAPDKDFHDYRLHSYPASYDKAVYWLDLTKESLNKKDYDNASYEFGVATHYIDDSFSSPHYIKNEDSNLHAKFESQGDYSIKAKCKFEEFDLNQSLYQESQESYLWYAWLESRDDLIPQEKIEKATSLIYSIALETFDTSCASPTKITKSEFHTSKTIIIFGIIIAIIILLIIISLIKSSKS